jgi:hypothetical protein
MKTFRDLKIGDTFYYSDGKKIEKHKILRIKDDHFYRRYWSNIVGYEGITEYVIPLVCVDTPYCHDYGIYVDPEYILEQINNEYFTLDTE